MFTTELVEGVPVDKCLDMDEPTRKHICRLVMQLCLRELFQFRYMQTDPNWSNFFYNVETKQVISVVSWIFTLSYIIKISIYEI